MNKEETTEIIETNRTRAIAFILAILIVLVFLFSSYFNARMIIGRCVQKYEKNQFFGIEIQVIPAAKSRYRSEEYSILFAKPQRLMFQNTDSGHIETFWFNPNQGGLIKTICLHDGSGRVKFSKVNSIKEGLKSFHSLLSWEVFPLIFGDDAGFESKLTEHKRSYVGIEEVNKIPCYKIAIHDGYNWHYCAWIGCNTSLVHKFRTFEYLEPTYFDGHMQNTFWKAECLLYYFMPMNLGVNAEKAVKEEQYKDSYYSYFWSPEKLDVDFSIHEK